MGLGWPLCAFWAALGESFGVLWETLGGPLGPFWSLLESLGNIFGHLGVTWDPKSHFRLPLGSQVGQLLGHLEYKTQFLLALLGNPIRILMESWGILWEPLGNLWGKSRKCFENSDGILRESPGTLGESLGNPFRIIMKSLGNP